MQIDRDKLEEAILNHPKSKIYVPVVIEIGGVWWQREYLLGELFKDEIAKEMLSKHIRAQSEQTLIDMAQNCKIPLDNFHK